MKPPEPHDPTNTTGGIDALTRRRADSRAMSLSWRPAVLEALTTSAQAPGKSPFEIER